MLHQSTEYTYQSTLEYNYSGRINYNKWIHCSGNKITKATEDNYALDIALGFNPESCSR